MTTATATQFVKPRVDIYESPEAVTLEAELPGVPKDGAEIEVHDGKLTLQAKRVAPAQEGALRLQERSEAGYYRAFQLGEAIDATGVTANMSDGVLVITLPKSEKLKPRVVSVN